MSATPLNGSMSRVSIGLPAEKSVMTILGGAAPVISLSLSSSSGGDSADEMLLHACSDDVDEAREMLLPGRGGGESVSICSDAVGGVST